MSKRGTPAQYVTITSAIGKVSALMDESFPAVTDGYGGWKEVDRVRRTAYVSWPGKKALKMTIGIIFDGKGTAGDGDDEPVNADVKRLEQMALPRGGTSMPPRVKIIGHVPHTDLDWVIDNITWGDSERNKGGALIRQKMVITFWQWVPEDIITKSPASNAKAKSKSSKKKEQGSGDRTYIMGKWGYVPDLENPPAATVYTARAGETMTTIAASFLGNFKRWDEIADLNGLRNPLAYFEGGERLKVPNA